MINPPDDLTYRNPTIITSLNQSVSLIFADDTASGRPCPFIDKIMTDRVIPYYSNTHSNAFAGKLMSKQIEKTRNFIKNFYNLSSEHVEIFTGNGATGAINHFVNLIDCSKYDNINIYVSIFEHHSNYLPWYELSKKNSNVKVNIIPLGDDELPNFKWLCNKLGQTSDHNTLNIVSITACSNVTGIMTDIPHIQSLISKYENTRLLLDCACIAPYKKINAEHIDGMFISGHKFLGGCGASGILIAKKSFFQKRNPFCAGGGCVIKADTTGVIYDSNVETKESAGTPNVLGIIRMYYAYKMTNNLLNTIEHNEKYLTKYVHDRFTILCKKYPELKVIMLNKNLDNRLPIISFSVNGLHFNYIVVLLSDLFGIQTRGGISCCGLFAQHLMEKYKIGGWTRVTFSWRMSIETVNFILDCIEKVIIHGKKLQKLYTYDEKENEWHIKKLLFNG
jgi:selenocysteine lyase/cysteine desulfurase